VNLAQRRVRSIPQDGRRLRAPLPGPHLQGRIPYTTAEFFQPQAEFMIARAALKVAIAAAGIMTLAACAVRTSTMDDNRLAQLQRQVASLEQRKTQLEDINAIKRLQRAYGYYMDEALWDEAADLFAEDGSIEIGLDGVYRGKRRVREYLYALGNGKAGLAPGQLNEHMQLMPVVTVAPDGLSAQGTWRDVIMAGQLGQDAVWGEGPYENEYVKVDGVWKIRKLHWFQTTLVPYKGGWVKHEDVNAGRFVGDKLKPDEPPSIEYKTWPSVFVPPFHFKNTATDGDGARPESVLTDQTIDSLRRQAAVLTQDVQRLRDQYEIETLQRIYGFYIDKGMWSQAADLFADAGTVEIAGRGIYVGKARVLEYLRAIGPEGPAEGRLFDNMQLQPIVHVAADGKSAKGRWRLFAQLAQHKQFAEWGVGVYENEYVKEGGVWKIGKLLLYPTMYTPFEDGWSKTAQAYSKFEPTLAPDRASSSKNTSYENVFVAPFHYEHPVAGKLNQAASTSRPGPLPQAEALDAVLAALDHEIGVLEDVAAVDRLQTIYGYYLATLQWDLLADLFDENGTIEIALRGVYVGKAGVRRNLNLYGQQGLDHGVMHNHMQYQKVIHVAPDRKTAKLRSRAFSMLGSFGKPGLWMAGTYENEFVNVNGVWKFKKDQVMNTYFAPYDAGWKDLAPRLAPGITDSNPPDRPPSFHFDMYPKSFLPPYHYSNPVTGKR
jgi:hypothetical protein